MPPFQGLGQRPADGSGRVVDQNIDWANGFRQLVDRVQVRQVHRHRDRLAAARLNPSNEGGQQMLAAGDGDHRSACGGELLGADLTDA
jgi:hypothetical protein